MESPHHHQQLLPLEAEAEAEEVESPHHQQEEVHHQLPPSEAKEVHHQRPPSDAEELMPPQLLHPAQSGDLLELHRPSLNLTIPHL